MSLRHHPSGKELYRLLPEEHRYRDRESGDLKAYLDGFGHLFDLLANTLRQRYADAFPEPLDDKNAAQDWILPYLADLVAARLLSPYADGRRAEVANAISWRQRRGTLTVVEQLAEAVAFKEAESQEGWQRVAVTPRIDTPLIPASALGDETHPLDLAPEEGGPDSVFDIEPLVAADHPGLNTATLDLRQISRAVAVAPGTAGSQRTSFFTGEFWWRQLNPRGVPCFPGSYEDASKRTVDIRTPPTWKHGHFHPKRLILFLAPPYGLFQPDALVFATIADAVDAEAVARTEDDFDVTLTRISDEAVVVEQDVTINDGKRHRYDGLLFDGEITVAGASFLDLSNGAVRDLVVTVVGNETPAATLKSAIVDTIDAGTALIRMEYVTVLDKAILGRIQASEAVFASDKVELTGVGEPRSCIRYSRVPDVIAGWDHADLTQHANTTDRPIFYPFPIKTNGGFETRPARFGEPGCAVLHLASPPSILAGAEDDGEMGALHEHKASAAVRALLTKLEDYLPIGLEAVALYDRRLLQAPPRLGDGA
ncbi:MAG: phage tail protein [Pseudomonadota bacterium]